MATSLMALAVPALGAGVGDAAAAPDSDPIRYVSIGDSYTAGAGVEPAAPNRRFGCDQSSNNYPSILARELGYRHTEASCAAATTDHFFVPQFPWIRPQLDALGPDTDLVTFTIGGNDSDLVGTMIRCVVAGVTTHGRGEPCQNTYGDRFTEQIRSVTYPRLVRAMRAVRAKAPNAEIAALSYPFIAPPDTAGCIGLPVAGGDLTYLHKVQAEINDAVRRAAQNTGVRFVDAATPSVGHDSCRPVGVRWVEPVLNAQDGSEIHPNSLGQRAMAEIVQKALALR